MTYLSTKLSTMQFDTPRGRQKYKCLRNIADETIIIDSFSQRSGLLRHLITLSSLGVVFLLLYYSIKLNDSSFVDRKRLPLEDGWSQVGRRKKSHMNIAIKSWADF